MLLIYHILWFILILGISVWASLKNSFGFFVQFVFWVGPKLKVVDVSSDKKITTNFTIKQKKLSLRNVKDRNSKFKLRLRLNFC